MIAHLRGKLLVKHPNQAIIETAGVGYDVTISVPTFSDLPSPGADVALHIHTHVREDMIALYGFLRPSEKLLFEKLITVSGIGPKLADYDPEWHGRRRDGRRNPGKRRDASDAHPRHRKENGRTHGA